MNMSVSQMMTSFFIKRLTLEVTVDYKKKVSSVKKEIK
jgi:hypothetical protein